MPHPCPDTHWSAHFPELQVVDPRLDMLRHALTGPDAPPPLETLAAMLSRVLPRPLELSCPGTAARSFDERWLLACFEALRCVDLRWYQFLLRSRMAPGDAARVHFALTQAQVWLEERL